MSYEWHMFRIYRRIEKLLEVPYIAKVGAEVLSREGGTKISKSAKFLANKLQKYVI